MDRKMILSVLAIAVFGVIGVMLILPDPIEDGIPRLPWLIEQTPEGHTRAFGFTLGKTTLAEVRNVFNEEGTINLFASGTPDARTYTVEAYFQHVYLHRLRADFVLTLDAPREMLGAMFDRGLRISQVGSGSKKIKLDPEDIDTLLSVPVGSITYLPMAQLDADLLEKRFGKPDEKRTEENGVTHWLYPTKGLDIGREPGGSIVMQYVDTRDFSNVINRLPELPTNDISPAQDASQPADARIQ